MPVRFKRKGWGNPCFQTAYSVIGGRECIFLYFAHAQKQHKNTHQGSTLRGGLDQEHQIVQKNCDCVINDYKIGSSENLQDWSRPACGTDSVLSHGVFLSL